MAQPTSTTPAAPTTTAATTTQTPTPDLAPLDAPVETVPADPCAVPTTTPPATTTTTTPPPTTTTTTPLAVPVECVTATAVPEPAAPKVTPASDTVPAPAAPEVAPTLEPAPPVEESLAPLPAELRPAAPAGDQPVFPEDPELSSKTAEPDLDWAPTENPKSEIVPGQMRSDREEIPAPFTKEDADKAEMMEAQERSALSRMSIAAVTCQTYLPSPFQVCGAIRDKYNSLGGPASFLTFPTSGNIINPDGVGERVQFLNGPIYAHPDTGAHPVVNSFLNRWGILGYESAAGMLGYPTTDEIVHADGVGRRQEFQRGAIYVAFQNAIDSAIRNGLIRDKWNTVSAHEPGSLLGYPIQDPVNLPDGQGRMSRFERGVIYWHPGVGTHIVHGEILNQWAAQGYESGPAGYPLEDQRQISATGFEQMFQNATHAWPRRVSDDYCGSVCTDDVYNQFPEMRGVVDLISQIGAPACDTIPPAAPGADETFYECYDPSPALSMPQGDPDEPSARGAYSQPSGSILQSQCYQKGPGQWTVERFYSCVYLDTHDGHGVRGDKGGNGGYMVYKDVEIFISRSDDHGRRINVGFRAIPDLSGLAVNTILEVYPKCSIPGESCTFSPVKGYDNIHSDEPVEFHWEKEFDAPAAGAVTAPQISFEMKHVSTGSGPTSYKPAPLPYAIGDSPIIRCDSFPRMRGTSDCIFPTAMPVISFSPKYNVPEAEWHITKAQESGLPGGSKSSPLHRATPAETAVSASIACKTNSTYPPRPTGKQCDEYPFKSTQEGARMGGVGSERTFHPYCGMKHPDGSDWFPETTGPTGFSVCMINGSQNGSAGSALTWLWQRYRVGEGEAFVLKSQPGEAPTSGPVIN